jgi:hypothetical protein
MRRRAAGAEAEKGHATKYRPGLDPLERETQISDIRPLDGDEQKRMFEMVDLMLQRGGLGPEEQKALKIWKTNLLAENLEGHVRGEFLRDFWAWLLGRGKEEDHKKCWWYRQSLADDPQVAAYIDVFIRKMHSFKVKLELLSRRRPIGINQCYLFFKYIVRGESKGENSKFLKDWDIFLDEFEVARSDFDQEHVDKKLFPHPHETAPYNEGDGAEAAVNPRRDIAQKRENNENLVQKLVDGFDGGEDDDSSSDTDSDKMDTSSVDETQVDLHVDAMNRQTAAIEKLTDALLSPEKRAQFGHQGSGIGNEEVARLEGEIGHLKQQLQDKETAKQPTDDEKGRLAQIEAQKQAAKEQTDRIAGLLQGIQDGQKRQREEQQQQFADLLHRIQGKEKGEIVADDGGAAFRRQFAEWITQFQRYSDQMDKRLGQIEGNIKDGVGSGGVHIEELENITSSLGQIAGLLKDRPNADLSQLQAAHEAWSKAMFAGMLTEFQRQQGNSEKVIGHILEKHREEMAKQPLLLESLEQSLKRMQGSEAVQNLLQSLPAANAKLMEQFLHQFKSSFDMLGRMSQLESDNVRLHEERLNAATVLAAQQQAIAQLKQALAMQAEQANRLRIGAGQAINDADKRAQEAKEAAELALQRQKEATEAAQREAEFERAKQRAELDRQQAEFRAYLDRLQSMQSDVLHLEDVEGPEAMEVDEDTMSEAPAETPPPAAAEEPAAPAEEPAAPKKRSGEEVGNDNNAPEEAEEPAKKGRKVNIGNSRPKRIDDERKKLIRDADDMERKVRARPELIEEMTVEEKKFLDLKATNKTFLTKKIEILLEVSKRALAKNAEKTKKL